MAGVMFAGGGTGGHLYPAFALAEELKRQRPELALSFMGTPNRLEATLVPKQGYRFHAVEVRGMPRKLGPELLGFGVGLGRAIAHARRILATERPEIVVGTGGYVSAPAVVAARLEGIPVLLLEQNARPGLANRALSRLADRVFTSFPGTEPCFPRGKAQTLGTPIRPEVYLLGAEEARARLGFPQTPHLLLVTGGSLGAKSVNRALLEALPAILDHEDWSVLHAAGSQDYSELKQQAPEHERYRLVEYLDDMPAAIASADLVVGRAGATTVAELTAAGKPMVLIPYPYGGGDQPINAKRLEQAGAAIVIPDDRASELGQALASLLDEGQRRAQMAGHSRSAGHPEAARAIALEVLHRLGLAHGGI